MISVIWFTVTIILLIIGAIDCFRIVTLFILRNKQEDDIILLIPIEGHNEKVELVLRSAVARLKWFWGFKKQTIICLDLGMDAETRKVCELFSNDYWFMDVCDREEFQEFLMSKS